jgi:hypothetical protein
LLAVIRDLNPINQFHHEIRPPRVRGTCVQHLGNV